jgi:thiosulfate/3-mercaptopyruvate sulfurtransferase
MTYNYAPPALPRRLTISLFASALVLLGNAAIAAKPAASIPETKLMQPSELAAVVKSASSAKPLLFHVGFKTMFDQAHIPGSEYVGPGNTSAGLKVLRDRVANLSKDTQIVIYCGCCPWDRCPNMAAAYDTLLELGFTKVKGMYIADNFGTDWVEKGYPTKK